MKKPRLRKHSVTEFFQKENRNKQALKWLCLGMPQPAEEEGDKLVVKGISKRIIVVKSPDQNIFEQAIFIIREDYAGQSGLSERDVYMEATKAANRYLGTKRHTAARAVASLRAPLYAAAGAAATGLAWIAVQFSHL